MSARTRRVSAVALATLAVPSFALAAPAQPTAATKVAKRSVLREIPTFRSLAGADARVAFADPAQTPLAPPLATAAHVSVRPPDVRPVLECVATAPDGGLVAVFGHDNRSDAPAQVPPGPDNAFHPAPALRNQPTTFASGRRVGEFRVSFSGVLVWKLLGRTSTASATSKRCAPEPQALLDRAAVVTLDETAGGPEYWALKTAGVPTVLATSVADALTSRVVILAGTLSHGRISDGERAALEAFVARGGVIVGEAVTDAALLPLFGVQAVGESNTRTRLDWIPGDPTVANLDRPEERAVSLADRAQGEAVGTVGYAPAPGAVTLASFDDGLAAVTRRSDPSGGAAYAIGARLLDLVTRHHEGARMSGSAKYENTFDTAADGWILWLRGLHRTHNRGGVTLSSAPDGRDYAVIPTLSMNLSEGVGPTLSYLRLARRAGARPTVFLWTHTVDDWLDAGFFGSRSTRARIVSRYQRLGAEVASHSVSHSPRFARGDEVPVGSGAESAASYAPRVLSRERTLGASVFGDLRVSRELLESAGARPVRSYRQGYLLTRRDLAPAQDASGYLFDSSTTQGFVGGAYPFMPPRLDGAGFSSVVTFPIVLEDERDAPFHTRIPEGLDLIAANGANGAPSVIMVHPNPTKAKQRAWKALLRSLPANAWRGTLGDFGDFWTQRLQGRLSTAPSALCAGGVHVELASPRADWPLRRQTLDVADQALVTFVAADGARRPVERGKVVLPEVPGGGVVAGELCPAMSNTR